MPGDIAKNLAVWGAPVFDELGLSVYDIEVNSGRLVVMVDRQGGVGLDEIARCTRALSPILEEHDPIAGHYTLEVSSPGLERRLRTVEHRRDAVGEMVKCKVRGDDGGVRRLRGVLSDVDDDTLVIDTEDGPVSVRHDQATSMRTVFVWPDPGTTKGRGRSNPSDKATQKTAGKAGK